MSSHKQYTLPSYQVITTQAVSGDVTSSITEIKYKDNIIYQIVWTGTLVGTFYVLTSVDYNHVTGVGTWNIVPIDSGAVAAGSADSGTIELNQLSAPYVKLFFDYTSGSGNLTATVSGKVI